MQHYLKLDMHLYQIVMLLLMNLCPLVVIVAARAAAKSFVIAVFSCARCILYPGTIVVIASSTKKQSSLIISEKIKKELVPNSHNLAREIKEIKTGVNETEVIFKNGSSIIVVPASENGRGYRANIIIYEEFRLIKKEIIDSVLSPFLFIRQAPYLKNPKYEHLKEEPIEIYISSAYFSSHWMSKMIKLATKDMYNKSSAVILGFDYSITLKHNIRTRNQIVKEKKKLGSLVFAMEYENEMIGQGEGAFFPFEALEKLQNLNKAFYPLNWGEDSSKNKFAIPRQAGEIRVVSVDIAMVARKENDNSVITCIRALPNGDYYERQVPYIEGFKGMNTDTQALRIKEIFFDFDADYIVLDCQNAGLSVFDSLGKISYDENRDIEYPAFTCFNDKEVASRVKNRGALPKVFSFKGQLGINQEMHYKMQDVITKGRIKLLLNSNKAKDYLEEKSFYNKILNAEEQAKYEIPYIQTDLLISEMINLSRVPKKNYLTLEEPSTGTKDRYISAAMGNYLIDIFEKDLQEDDDDDEDWDDMPLNITEIKFII